MLAISTRIFLAGGGTAFAAAPCGVLVSPSQVAHAVGYPQVHLVRERNASVSPTNALPFYLNGPDTILLACRYEAFSDAYGRGLKRFREGHVALITIVVGEKKQLPVDTDGRAFLEAAKESLELPDQFSLPGFGAQASRGFQDSAALKGAWWSLTVGRKLEIEVRWNQHRRARRGIVKRLGADLVGRAVVHPLKLPTE